MSMVDRLLAGVDMPEHHRAAARASIAQAGAQSRKVLPYSLSAPIIMALVVPFLPRNADRLGAHYQVFSTRRWEPFCVRRNLGYKVRNVQLYGAAKAMVVYIAWSLQSWKKPPGE